MPPVQEVRWTEGSADAGKCGRENGVHVAAEAQVRGPSLLTLGAVVAVGQKVVAHGRCVEQRLEHRVHETRVAEIVETAQAERDQNVSWTVACNGGGMLLQFLALLGGGRPGFEEGSRGTLAFARASGFGQGHRGRVFKRLSRKTVDRAGSGLIAENCQVETGIILLVIARSTKKFRPVNVNG